MFIQTIRNLYVAYLAYFKYDQNKQILYKLEHSLFNFARKLQNFKFLYSNIPIFAKKSIDY